MRKRISFKVIAVTLVVGLVPGAWAKAQIPVWQQTAAENARGGAVRGRTPGNMVSAGVARALAFADASRAGVQITDIASPSSLRTNAMVASITALFEELNKAFLVIGNLLLARAGIGDDTASSNLEPSSTLGPESNGETVSSAVESPNPSPSSGSSQSGGRR